MKLTGIDLNLFLVFEAIYTERNLTRASGILSVTQPAVSNALARLRAAFGDPLFERRGGAMAPTPVAQSLIGPVRQALARLRSGLDQRARFEPGTSDRIFHIAMRDTAATFLMPGLADRLTRIAPQVQLHCAVVDRAEIPLELAAGTLDFAIDIPQLTRSDLSSVALMSDRYVCAMRRGHPQAKLALTLERFLALRQINVSGRRRGKSVIELALTRLGRVPNVVMRLPNFPLAFDVVQASDLVVTAPFLLTRSYDVAVKEMPLEPAELQSLLYWHRNAESDPGNQWLRAKIVEAASAFLKPPSAARGRRP